ncbi:ATP-binding protein [Amycolatopsis australiensis]|uniref:Anti-sigma regulatory factor (Ser/Thr protein kinase) n=1 Tax=Amycolatopsis australiensis TaxID=546364 RepID=A0A1K1SSP9_9PSEU|nr:ATP-binding protein [Amycolatopsis australiensis]SFW86909.1 Anti-sigma regulatory factor (Ser/Thr protein kinase) [Amycolatopsis australiensis]
MPTQAWERANDDRDDPVVRCDLDTTPFREVRRLVRGLLVDRGDVVVEDATLIADELVSNAHQHAPGPRMCRLSLLDHGRYLRIEVEDASPAPPRIRAPDARGGRGMVLIDQLASSWGVEHHDHHKTVWAHLRLDRAGSNSRARHLALAPRWPLSGVEQ